MMNSFINGKKLAGEKYAKSSQKDLKQHTMPWSKEIQEQIKYKVIDVSVLKGLQGHF